MTYSKIGVVYTDDIWVLSKATGSELRFGKNNQNLKNKRDNDRY